MSIGVLAGGRGGLQAPQSLGNSDFFGQLKKIWEKPVFKDISMSFYYFEERNIFYFNLKLA